MTRRYRRGDRVKSMRWSGYYGTVVRVRWGGTSLGVRWDGTSFEDETFPEEIRRCSRPEPGGGGRR